MDGSEYFYCRNGKVARSLEDLADILQDMPEDEFSHHVNDSKNDFSSWILHVLHNPELADKVRRCSTKEESLLILNEEIMRKSITEKFQEFTGKGLEPDLVHEDELQEPSPITMTVIPKDEDGGGSIWLAGEKTLPGPVAHPLLESPHIEVDLKPIPAKPEPAPLVMQPAEQPKQAAKQEITQEPQQAPALKVPRREFTLKEFIFGIFLGFVLGFVIAKIVFATVLK